MKSFRASVGILGAAFCLNLMAQPQQPVPAVNSPKVSSSGAARTQSAGKPDTPQALAEFNETYAYLQTNAYSRQNGPEAQRRVLEFGKKYPETAAAFALLGELKYVLFQVAGGCGMTDEVVMLARRAISVNPNSAEGYTLGAKAALCNRDASVYWYADKALSIAPNKPEALYVKARVLEQQKQFGDAEVFFRRTIDSLQDPRRKANIYAWMAQMLTSDNRNRNDVLKDIGKAEDAHLKTLQLDPNNVDRKCDYLGFLIQFKPEVSAAERLSQEIGQGKSGCSGDQARLLKYATWAKKYLAGQETTKSLQKVAEAARLDRDDAFIIAARLHARGDVVRALLRSKAISNVDTIGSGTDRGAEGCCTALINAAYQGDAEIATLLLKGGANANASQGNTRRTPLSYATMGGEVKLTEILLASGARPNVVFDNGIVPLYWALKSDLNSAKLVELLLANRANPNLSVAGMTLLEWAIQLERVDALKLLLAYGANPNPPAANPTDWSPIQRTMFFEANPEIVAVLLAAGSKNNVPERNLEDYLRKKGPTLSPEKIERYRLIFALFDAARGKAEKGQGK